MIPLVGCSGNTQRISIDTDPVGAEVFLQRRGTVEIEADAGAVGVTGKFDGGKFEDEFVSLGNAPVDYQFELEESKAEASYRGQGGTIRKRYEEGSIRIQRAGYGTVVRVVSFTGSRIALSVTLQPKP